VSQNNENVYNLEIEQMQSGNFLYFVLIGYLSNYQEAYQTNIYIADLAAPSSNLFLKSTSMLKLKILNKKNLVFIVPIEFIQSSFQENIPNTQTTATFEVIQRKTSVIIIIVYAGIIFTIIILYMVVSVFILR